MDKKSVERIANLSRLHVTENDIAYYSETLTMILKHFEDLATLNTDGVEPLVTPTQIVPHLAQDKVEQITTTEEIIKNAPEKSGNLFKVPPVVGT
jgi:aspartyl-tRNA(Asn)/glutamyl-tRNA(Gln) amidotransferase subunit C